MNILNVIKSKSLLSLVAAKLLSTASVVKSEQFHLNATRCHCTPGFTIILKLIWFAMTKDVSDLLFVSGSLPELVEPLNNFNKSCFTQSGRMKLQSV